ncbi:MAG: TIGR02444 family protein [Chromatiaceae bacterium]|nr:TIGR02444 family protein [Chromatiaceae bacterium]
MLNSKQPTAPSAEQFWQFSLKLYPAIKPLCLDWQDRLGANVNLLLLLCYLEQQQLGFSANALMQLSAELENFSRQFTRPLRQLRRSASQSTLNPAQQQQLKQHLLNAELELERLEQQLLLAHCPLLTASPTRLVEHYLALLNADPDTCSQQLIDLRQKLLQLA